MEVTPGKNRLPSLPDGRDEPEIMVSYGFGFKRTISPRESTGNPVLCQEQSLSSIHGLLTGPRLGACSFEAVKEPHPSREDYENVGSPIG